LRGTELITPDLASGVLESITRDTVLQLASRELGLNVSERPVDRAELYVADEIFFMGTGWEILSVGAVDALPVGNGAPPRITHMISALYDDVVRGRVDERRQWCECVW